LTIDDCKLRFKSAVRFNPKPQILRTPTTRNRVVAYAGIAIN